MRYGFKSIVRLFGAYYPRHCTVCGYKGRFFSYGYPLVADVLCPSCLSLERHRALAIYDEENDLFSGKDILHFAPEPGIEKLIRGRSPKSYRTCDLYAKKVDLRINIEDIDLPDASVELIICSHVLEHVDDAKAIPELRRILQPSGTAIVMVPLEEGLDETYENQNIVSRSGRLLHFGQEDHVRYYGRDIRDRLRAANFSVTEWTSREPQVSRHGLKRGEKIFICKGIE
jgi:SAM-dependent methyltransferase